MTYLWSRRRRSPLHAARIIAFRRYIAFAAAANLTWEFLHLPLYTIWAEGSTWDLVFAAVHCTGGDVMIAGTALLLGIIFAGRADWPRRRFAKVGALTVAFGVSYTVLSERLNVSVWKTWAYSELMPIVPVFEVGLSPIAQWLTIPLLALWWSRRPTAVCAAGS